MTDEKKREWPRTLDERDKISIGAYEGAAGVSAIMCCQDDDSRLTDYLTPEHARELAAALIEEADRCAS